jgi:hypothetical protein
LDGTSLAASATHFIQTYLCVLKDSIKDKCTQSDKQTFINDLSRDQPKVVKKLFRKAEALIKVQIILDQLNQAIDALGQSRHDAAIQSLNEL